MRHLLVLALMVPGYAHAQRFVEGFSGSGAGATAVGGTNGAPRFQNASFSVPSAGAALNHSAAFPAFSRKSFAADLSKLRAIALEVRTYYPEVGVALGDGMKVEGSRVVGGRQNDFRIDYSDADLYEKLVLPARRIGSSGLYVWDKVLRIQELVNTLIPRDGLGRRTYDELNASAMANEDVSLGSYIRARTGVCRENAMMTALALREAGLEARFAYFGVYEDNGDYDQDHATALVDVDGVTYIVDSFKPFGRYYNGHRLADLLQAPADRTYPGASPITAFNDRSPGGWRLAPHSFPRVGRLVP